MGGTCWTAAAVRCERVAGNRTHECAALRDEQDRGGAEEGPRGPTEYVRAHGAARVGADYQPGAGAQPLPQGVVGEVRVGVPQESAGLVRGYEGAVRAPGRVERQVPDELCAAALAVDIGALQSAGVPDVGKAGDRPPEQARAGPDDDRDACDADVRQNGGYVLS